MSFNRKLAAAVLFTAIVLSFNPCAFAELLEGLVAYWPLDESSGTDAPDVFGPHDGTLTATDISWTTGKLGNAVDCHGSDFGNGYVNIPQHSELKPPNISIQAWVSLDAFGDWDGIVANFEDTNDTESGWALFTHGTNTVSWYVSVAGSMRWTSVTVSAGQWTHIVGTYDGTNVRLYKNAAAGGRLFVSTDTGYIYMFGSSFLPADFDKSGTVDLLDLLIFVGDYFKCTNPNDPGCQNLLD